MLGEWLMVMFYILASTACILVGLVFIGYGILRLLKWLFGDEFGEDSW